MPRLSFLLAGLALLTTAGGTVATSDRSAASAPDATTKPRRVVSLNLCTDQLLLAVADRDQIAGLTRLAADPAMSTQAETARGLHLITSGAEEIVALSPDLVVGLPAWRSASFGVLQERDYPALDLSMADSLEAIRASIREIAAATGHAARGEAMIAEMDRQIATTPKPGRGRVAAYYQRRGYLTGTGTLVDDMMTRIGVVNLARKLNRPPLSQLSLEEMVAARPDFLIVEDATSRVNDQGSEMLHHPALRGIPRITVPQAWTVCGNQSYALALRSMADQIMAIDAGRR